MRCLIFTILIFSLAGVYSWQQLNNSGSTQDRKSHSYAILPPFAMMSDLDPWMPSDADIAKTEASIEAYLQEKQTVIHQKLGSYKRQYGGYAFRDGRRFIYGNFFCNDPDLDWRKEVVSVQDGGDCFFNFKVYASTWEVFDFQVNGAA